MLPTLVRPPSAPRPGIEKRWTATISAPPFRPETARMPLRIGVVMDPIARIKPYKDTTFAMMLAAQAAGHELIYLEQADLYLRDGIVHGRGRPVTVRDQDRDWFSLGDASDAPLTALDALLMRKDPPFDMEYVYCTYLLERAQADGLNVFNDPRSIRDANEKLFTAWFPEVCPSTLVTRDAGRLRAFLAEHGRIVLKPLDGMGGASIFRVDQGDMNTGVIIETLTDHGRRFAMAQRYLPQIAEGDKRVLVIDGEVVSHCLARIPAAGEARGNLAAGGRGVVQPISASDRAIAERVAPELVKRGLLFVGLDIIGDKLTEINVTSPTCLREISRETGQDLAGQFMRVVEKYCADR